LKVLQLESVFVPTVMDEGYRDGQGLGDSVSNAPTDTLGAQVYRGLGWVRQTSATITLPSEKRLQMASIVK
jgi:hypothetical protein